MTKTKTKQRTERRAQQASAPRTGTPRPHRHPYVPESAAQKETRSQTKFSLKIFRELKLVLSPGNWNDIATLEKLSVMVGVEITEATLYACLDSTKTKKPDNPMAYFFGGLKNQVPTLYDDLKAIAVRPYV